MLRLKRQQESLAVSNQSRASDSKLDRNDSDPESGESSTCPSVKLHQYHPEKSDLSPGILRLKKDVANLDAGNAAKLIWPDPSNLMFMELLITPEVGLWTGAPIKFTIQVTTNYPHDPPNVLCITPVYHPNINVENGKVCLNILNIDYRPSFELSDIINGLIFLFYEPNVDDDGVNPEASILMRTNKLEFERRVYDSLRGKKVSGMQYPVLIND